MSDDYELILRIQEAEARGWTHHPFAAPDDDGVRIHRFARGTQMYGFHIAGDIPTAEAWKAELDAQDAAWIKDHPNAILTVTGLVE